MLLFVAEPCHFIYRMKAVDALTELGQSLFLLSVCLFVFLSMHAIPTLLPILDCSICFWVDHYNSVIAQALSVVEVNFK